MIVPMKKVAVICLARDSERTIENLRCLGVVHVEHAKPPKSKEIAGLQEDIIIAEKALTTLGAIKEVGRTRGKQELLKKDWKKEALHVIDLSRRLSQLDEFAGKLKLMIDRWQEWGDFNPKLIDALAAKGIIVRLCQVPAAELGNIPPGVISKKVSSSHGLVNCALISRQPVELPYRLLTPPKISLSQMRERLAKDTEAMDDIKRRLKESLSDLDLISRAKRGLQKELEFRKAIDGMGQEGAVSYLAGYVPYDAGDRLIAQARQAKWGLLITDPSEEDNVPTLVRNPKWVSIIAPVFRVLEVVPGYHELDISIPFLVFFSIFFGMIIGDAAYGAIFLVATVFAQRKFKARVKDSAPFVLLYVLSGSAIVWGLATGTVFGHEWLAGSFPPLLPALQSDKNVQTLCFLLGAIHLSIAHLWRAALKYPSPNAVADIGWTTVLWGMFFMARFLILGAAFPAFTKWLFIVGSALVVLFNKPARNPLKWIGSGLGALALSFMNTFTDVVSYVRLFAVGLAGVAVADAFNKMALSVGFGNLFTGLATAAILFLGHALNIVLGPMSVLVHGVRLNVLEFCGHADVKWSGIQYNPLKD